MLEVLSDKERSFNQCKQEYLRSKQTVWPFEDRKFLNVWPHMSVPADYKFISTWEREHGQGNYCRETCNRGIAVLAHTRGVLAHGCWREQDESRVFRDTIVYLGKYDGQAILDCCTNCAWASANLDKDRRCTALPKHLPSEAWLSTPATDRFERLPDAKDYEEAYSHCIPVFAYHVPPAMLEGQTTKVLSLISLMRINSQQKSMLPFPSICKLQDIAMSPAEESDLNSDSSSSQSQDYYEFFDVMEISLALFVDLVRERERSWEIVQGRVMSKLDKKWESEDLNCDICCESFIDRFDGAAFDHNHLRAKTRCGHVFGSDCLTRWLREQDASKKIPSCPKCRQTVWDIAALPSRSQWKREQVKYLDEEKINVRIRTSFKHCREIQMILRQLDDLREEEVEVQISSLMGWAIRFLEIQDKFWFSTDRQGAKEAVGQAKHLAKEMIGSIECAPATNRFVCTTLTRADRWPPSNTDEAMKDFLDLFLLFMSRPNEFEKYCRQWEIDDKNIMGDEKTLALIKDNTGEKIQASLGSIRDEFISKCDNEAISNDNLHLGGDLSRIDEPGPLKWTQLGDSEDQAQNAQGLWTSGHYNQESISTLPTHLGSCRLQSYVTNIRPSRIQWGKEKI